MELHNKNCMGFLESKCGKIYFEKMNNLKELGVRTKRCLTPVSSFMTHFLMELMICLNSALVACSWLMVTSLEGKELAVSNNQCSVDILPFKF